MAQRTFDGRELLECGIACHDLASDTADVFREVRSIQTGKCNYEGHARGKVVLTMIDSE